MKKYLCVLMLAFAFGVPGAAWAHDSTDDPDNGYGNDEPPAYSPPVDNASDGHTGEEAQ